MSAINSQARTFHLSMNCLHTPKQTVIIEVLYVFAEVFIFPYIYFPFTEF